MCRIEEKVYIGSDGRKKTFQDLFDCERARRRGKRCSKPEKKTREYIGTPPIARADAPSPASNNPPTPSGVGSYIIEERRPSASGRRPSLKSEIIIQIGGGSKRDHDKKYSRKYTSTAYKRTSLGGSSIASNEVAVESPGSDASYPIRTGLPETAVPHTPPFGQPHGYAARHVVPQGHRHTTSVSSVTTSQTPSLYTTSETEPESPLGLHAPEYPRTIVHNTRPNPASPVTIRRDATQPSTYHTRLEVPHNSSRDTSSSRDNVGDYPDVVDMYASSSASSASARRAANPAVNDRVIDRERRRKMKEDEKRRKEEEEEERRLDERILKAEDQAKKEVRFAELETGRYTHRDQLRKEQKFAESEKQRAEERENERRRKKEAEERQRKKEAEEERQLRKETEQRNPKDPEKRATRKPEREKTQPPTRDFNKKPSGRRHSRSNSMTQADIDERNRLLFQEKLQMSLERDAAEEREAAELRQQQYSTRPQPHSTASYQSEPTTSSHRAEEPKLQGPGGKRRGSISINPPPMGNVGRRASIVQPNPPVLTPVVTAFPPQQTYATRPTSSLTNTQPYVTREALPSARYSPSQLGNPFGQPNGRSSNTSMETNPFAAPSDRPVHPIQPVHPPVPAVHHYPPGTTNATWDTRGLQNALPAYPPAQAAPYVAQGHTRAQQATQNMNRAYQMEDEWR